MVETIIYIKTNCIILLDGNLRKSQITNCMDNFAYFTQKKAQNDFLVRKVFQFNYK